ncbi:uncharacterized protein UTRI_02667 [Ustilago trichophora]|uniref:Uncharacterized protein n=1 Tax=Ustilago trichophora TaxID=86804 RepID=A0A5C3EPQ2_9BASI|nr:uncharacterized protein UTRI_02667 [Ustilago trichophora]
MKVLFFSLALTTAFLGMVRGYITFNSLCGDAPTAPAGTHWACFQLTGPSPLDATGPGKYTREGVTNVAVWLEKPTDWVTLNLGDRTVHVTYKTQDGCVSIVGGIRVPGSKGVACKGVPLYSI